MLKNIIIIILTLLVVLFWLSEEPEDYDPDGVIIEYRCSDLEDYESVPPEVLEECRSRGKISPVEYKGKPKTTESV